MKKTSTVDSKATAGAASAAKIVKAAAAAHMPCLTMMDEVSEVGG
jgi:hypothetical protein